jgi:hypothetical protein
MKPFLMGAETEYAVSGRVGQTLLQPREVHTLLYRALQRERHWLADVVGGEALYLEKGGRFYLDYGCHPEYATPECFTPQQVAAYDKAGERLLDIARRRVQEERPGTTITILKNNLHPVYPDDITWGTHESYTSWVPPQIAAARLIPHVVSRTIYAGAGCLSSCAEGMGFELSQRARHVLKPVGGDTTGDRPLFCTRIRKVSDGSGNQGWTRAHLISKDSQRAPLGVYLTYGVTGLLFLAMNEGHSIGRGLELEAPLQALRAFSCDPWLRTRATLTDGRKLTALAIQQCYLEECERIVQGGTLPSWAGEVVRHWGETLATLGKDPLRMARKLDPYYKLFVFDHELGRAGCSWAQLHEALKDLSLLRVEYCEPVIRAILTEEPSSLGEEERQQYDDALERVQLNQSGKLEHLRLAVRLQQMELLYHQVGGTYDQLTASGHLQPVVLGREEIEQASRQAPPGGRAAVRSELVRAMRDPGWLCEWRYLYHSQTDEFVDMRNPFCDRFEPSTWTSLSTAHPNDPDVQEIAAQLNRR